MTGISDGARPLGTCLVSPWSMPGAVLGAGTKAMSKTDAVPTLVRRGGSCDLATHGRKYRGLSEHGGTSNPDRRGRQRSEKEGGAP